MNKVICMGECLIDFLQSGDNLTFSAKAGGAPANVAAAVAKLGGQGYYLGKLSNDVFGKFLLQNMQTYNINTDFCTTCDYQTALAFVTNDENGDRKFNFYRKDTADLMFDESDVKAEFFKKGDILHFCSVGLTMSKSRYAHVKAIELARQNGAIISFDVNLRPNLWDSQRNLINSVKEFMIYADILKVSNDELVTITELNDEKTAVKTLFSIATDCKLIFITKGKDGMTVYDKNLNEVSEKSAQTKVVDTTGAGDCFIGSVLFCISTKNMPLTLTNMDKVLKFASIACSKVVAKQGAMNAMPTLDGIGYDF
ncbi:MAG: carbohydrate kinase [Eubacteriales bacterium]|nr:carbohydrate kinase [Eubacteriales bacterium]